MYNGGIHAFDYVEPHDPSRVLRQYGYRQTIPDSILTPELAYRPADGTQYVVRHSRFDYSRLAHLLAPMYLSTHSVVGSPNGNASPEYMAWYLDRTHPQIVPTRAPNMPHPPMVRNAPD